MKIQFDPQRQAALRRKLRPARGLIASLMMLTVSFAASLNAYAQDGAASDEAERALQRFIEGLPEREQLLQMTMRPTIQDMLRVFKKGFSRWSVFRLAYHDTKIDLIGAIAPEMIVQLEAAYPGATWAVLGRDAALFGDILEAFYLMHGQKDRVVRLNASTASFGLEKQELAFLAAAGLVDKNGRVKKKFVLLDPTSWNPNSQVRKLIASVYAVNDDPLLPRLANVVGLGTSHRGQQGEFISRTFNIEEFRRNTTIVSDPKPAPARVFYVDGRLSYLNPSPHYPEVAWHGSFQKFKLDFLGRPVAQPGPPSSTEHRDHVLWMMQKVIITVQSDEFRNQVETIAHVNYGYDFRANAIRGDFAYLEDDGKMSRFLKQHEWTESSIQAWLQETRASAAPGYRDLIDWRLMEIIQKGLEKGTLTVDQGANLLQGLIPHLDRSPEGLQLFTALLKRVSSSRQPSILDALMKYDWRNHADLWWRIVIRLHDADPGLARNFMITRPFDAQDAADQFFYHSRRHQIEERQMLKVAAQWAPDEYALRALRQAIEYRMGWSTYYYAGLQKSEIDAVLNPILREMESRRETSPSFWQRARRKVGNTCAGALRTLGK